VRFQRTIEHALARSTMLRDRGRPRKKSPSDDENVPDPLFAIPANPSDRLDAIGRYLNLRDWSFAVIDLMEVAGKAMTGGDRIEVCDQTLLGVAGLLRDLTQQIDEHVSVIRAS